MRNSVFITILASAAVATAQVTIDNGTYTCSKPNVDFCAGDSMKTDIIIRCDSTGRGQPGRCSDNLAGEPPMGVQPALCYQTDATAGDAACEKNCVVYGGSGNGNGTFTLPADQCTPSFSATPSSSPASTAAPTTGGGADTTTPATAPSTTDAVPTAPIYPSNGTVVTTGAQTSTKHTTSTTRSPIVPTTTSPTAAVSAGAGAIRAGGVVAGLGFAMVYML